jgi:hypothetical protein
MSYQSQDKKRKENKDEKITAKQLFFTSSFRELLTH